MVSAALFLLDWRIALVTILLLTTPLYVPKLIEKRLQRAQQAYIDAVERNLALLTDHLSGFEIIKNFSAERQIQARFARSNDEVAGRLLADTQLGIIARLITTLISYLSYFTVLVCAACLVLAGDFTAGDFFVAIGMIDQLSYPLISLSGILRQLLAVRPACREMEAFLAAPAAQAERGGRTRLRQEIRFDNVSFGYSPDRMLLAGFDLTLRRNGRYLLRGKSGSGKTTVTNLLLRYYDVSGGAITVDGAPLAAAGDPYALCTVVRQEAVLFHDTLRNNLTMYRDIPDETLLPLLQKLGLAAFASKAALDRTVTETGANLSGGEKKRVCLARALLRDTDVLILDEPLANLDAETADRIEDLLLSITDKTLLIVSHTFRPEKLGAFDRVITLAA